VLIRSDELLSGKHGDSGHFVRFYDDGDVMLDEVAGFLVQAVRACGKGIVIATQDHIDVLRRRLGPAAVQVAWMDADAVLAQFMVDGWPDPARFEAAVGTEVAAACARHDHACADTALVVPAEGDADIGRLRLEQEVRTLRAEVARHKDNEQADDHPCRLVALTGYGLAADRARSVEAGFDAHLVKPVNPDQVVRLAAF